MRIDSTRPKNLDLKTIKLPITAIASIFHRISGIVLFFALPGFLWMLQQASLNAESFADLKACIDAPLGKLAVFAALAALSYHLVAGLRHILMDMGIGESLEGGQRGATFTLILSAVLIACVGVWLW